jgi:hypothetical protein
MLVYIRQKGVFIPVKGFDSLKRKCLAGHHERGIWDNIQIKLNNATRLRHRIFEYLNFCAVGKLFGSPRFKNCIQHSL